MLCGKPQETVFRSMSCAVDLRRSLLYLLGEGFRAERIDIWLHVETNENAHQIKQGLYAIATGGVFGKGLGNSMQKLGYIRRHITI